MTAVLLSMHLAEGDALERALPPEQTDSLLTLHYGNLAREHNTDLPTIQRSYAWYVARPLTLRAMYETVVEDLNRLQGEWQGDGLEALPAEPSGEPAIGVGRPE